MTTKSSSAKSKRAVLSVHTDAQTAKRLDQLAASTGQTKSALTNVALASFLDHQEWVQQEIKAGLADIAAGRVIAQADMKTWAANLPQK